MKYGKYVKDGYIYGVSIGGGAECTEEEYKNILDIINNSPIAPSGYAYRLTEELEWELYELPPVEEEELATEEDYILALEQLGVNAYA